MNKMHRIALLNWAVVYPIITTLLLLLDPFVSELLLPVRTLVLTAIMVPVLVYLAMPAATRLASRWLSSNA